MRFCKSCKTVYRDGEDLCPACRKKTVEITDINEPVRLCTIGGTERTMLHGLLDDAGIPYMERNSDHHGVANEIVTGYDVKLNNISLSVPFQALPEASAILGTIESVRNPIEPMLPEIEAWISRLRSGEMEEKSQMSPALRTTIKVISALVFLILIAIVVLGTDKLMEIIKGLFGG